MGMDVHEKVNKSRFVAAPKMAKLIVVAIELGLVLLIAYLLAQLSFQFMEDRRVVSSAAPTSVARSEQADFSMLTQFDPFFRQVSRAPVSSQTSAAIPESSINLEVFGLRAVGGGEGTAIVKLQDGDQKLVRVGEQIGRGIQLAGVYVDRLEINRAGVREAIYLRPKNDRPSVTQQRPAPSSTRPANQATGAGASSPVIEQLMRLELEAVRRDRRIIGFRLPEVLPAEFRFVGLEAQDILLSVNGSPLASHERVQEMAEDVADASSLTIEVERRGERRVISFNLRGTG